jgi:hypothetical protein
VSSKTAKGRCVIFKLDITNNASSPETFGGVGSQQTAVIGNKVTDV